jgi:hypothetical protein
MENQAYEPTMVHSHYQESIQENYARQKFQVIEFTKQFWQL